MTTTAARPGPAPRPAPTPRGSAPAGKEKPKETFRDFVEQIVVAVLLAILIRGFDAEAFVIPTGSMAPTLMGRHKEITCPQCGTVYSVNLSEDVQNFFRNIPLDRGPEALCVNCRWQAPIGAEPAYKGDRILVMKFPYELPWLPGSGGPRRWDVVVFHYPEKPEQNYIKRCVGLPDEELMIRHGDVFTRPLDSDGPFVVARKPLDRMKAMAILVNDDAHRARLLADHPEWLRWKGSGGWSERKGASFAFSGGPKDANGRLGYRHLVPDPEQWEQLKRNLRVTRPARPTLITDFSSYNASTVGDSDPIAAWRQTDWVGDLLLEFDLDVEKVDGGTIALEMVEAGVTNRCVIDPQAGTAVLYHGDTKLGEAATPIKGTGRHSVGFANVDDRLTLWVDGRAPFGDGLAYPDGPDAPHRPTAADLDPVGITAWGVSARVSGLVLKRDIYYTHNPRYPDCSIETPSSFEPPGGNRELARVLHVYDVLADPERFAAAMPPDDRSKTYPIRPDNFLMLGDNSPRSSDSRAWDQSDRDWDSERSSWEVPRHLLIGRAFFIYWPHGVPFGPKIALSPDLRIPFRPYFERMKPIR
jgi:signal peptidase I